MSDTPETDYEETRLDAWYEGDRFVKSSTAKRFERERNKLRERVLELESALSFYAGSLREDGNGHEFQKETFIGQLARETLFKTK
jgi:hypothetical protein